MKIFTTADGDFSDTIRALEKATKFDIFKILVKAGDTGVSMLRTATPIDTGDTANSWSYDITSNPYTLTFYNSNLEFGSPVAILIQHGHGTRNGGYVQGTDYLNPVVSQVVKLILDELDILLN